MLYCILDEVVALLTIRLIGYSPLLVIFRAGFFLCFLRRVTNGFFRLGLGFGLPFSGLAIVVSKLDALQT